MCTSELKELMMRVEAPMTPVSRLKRLRSGLRESRRLVRLVIRGAWEHFRLAPWLTLASVAYEVITGLLPFASAALLALGVSRLAEVVVDPTFLAGVAGWQDYWQVAMAAWPVVWPFLAVAGIGVLQEILSLPNQLIGEALQDKVGDEVERRLSLQLLRLDLPRLESAEFQNLLDRVRGVEYSFREALRLVTRSVTAVISLVTAAVLLAHLSLWLLLVLAVIAVPGVVIGLKANNRYERLHREHGLERMLNYRFNDLVQSHESATEVRLNGAHFYLVDLAKEYGRRWRHRRNKVRWQVGWRTTLFEIGAELVRLGLEIWLVLRVLTVPGFGIGGYMFYTQIMTRFEASLSDLLRQLTQGHDTALELRAYYAILDMQPQIVSPPNARRIPPGHVPAIEFVNVGFTYPEGDEPVFAGLNLTIKAGERIALVGHNGAGKTTLIKLLARLYDPDVGAILVDGVDLRRYDLDDWHRTLGILLQDFNVYALSLRENVEIGWVHTAGDDERLNRALTGADTHSVAKKLKHGVDHKLSKMYKEGTYLSGGQQQRVALARTLYRMEAGVVVLDEPTAAVDARAETEIFNRLTAVCAGRTSIVISHRFSTVRKMDRIIFIQDGEVLEDGPHAELMRIEGGRYRELFEIQAEGFR